MKITRETTTKIRENLAAYLGEVGSAARNDILDGVMARLGLTERQMQDHNPSGTYHTLRSYVGGLVDTLAADGSLLIVNHLYSLASGETVTVKTWQCEEAVKAFLAGGKYQKYQVFEAIDRHFGVDVTPSKQDNTVLHSMVGNALSTLVKRGEVTVDDDGYALVKKEKITWDQPMEREVFKRAFLSRIHSMGGPFFEHFVCNLLEKYYSVTGRTVLVCEVTGGSSDGGIDVVVDTRDGLGFCDHVLVQAKCRDKIHVTEKEVREFYGAQNALEGSRGIYITTSTFHEGAQRLLDSLDNCVGVDGDKLFVLAERAAYGLVKGKNGYSFDETVFKR